MITPIEKTVLINAPASRIWEYLTHPERMKQWIGEPEMNIEIVTDWEVGKEIIIRGFHHADFENKGIVLQFEPNKLLQYSHLSSLSRLPDVDENYSVITFRLFSDKEQTALTVSVEYFPTESIYKHLDFYWKTTVEILKRMIEEGE
ncbi:MAG: ATPase [Candidatus Fluviicola riflensis]|nr:MAG: ATPase [Candidatus Fluviicola riflensis]OGS78292.1 MAG: ATPase [Candidatus Fluviicola riflensis]OGS85358.1 MAG: ATPase [Fluviicola sp. RIFCSPHIGHO2_01_FULL_43_53]OGS87400.1 MAG: ATPase [Fluviicola sp. RIFCSPHIGHO2_12_FULL_43_24]